jgi:hypothetical protein
MSQPKKNYPTNDESLAQTNEDIFEIAQVLVNLAIAVLLGAPKEAREQAIEAVAQYGNWRTIEMPPDMRRMFMVRNYGEEEVAAMEQMGWKSGEEDPS